MKTRWKMMGCFFFAMAFFPASLLAQTIDGTVTDGGGNPVVGANVVLIIPGPGGAQRVDSAITDAQGQYAFNNVTVGFWQLEISMAGYITTNGFVNITGQDATVDVTLTPTGGGGSTGTITGEVTDAGGVPVANATLILTNAGGGFAPVTTTTDVQGQYTFDTIPVANGYVVSVSATGYQNVVSPNIDIAAGQIVTLNFTLTLMPGTVSGTVSSSVNQAPIANAWVMISGGGGAFLDSALTDSLGQYRFNNVPNGANYRITVTAAGFQTAVNNTVTITDALRSGIADFSLVPINGVANTGSISGLIASLNSGIPISGAQVILSRGGFVPKTTTTNAQGQYLFDSIPAQNGYTVTVNAATYNSLVRNNVGVISGQTTVVDLNPISTSAVRPARGVSRAGSPHWVNGRLTLELGLSTRSRMVEVYGLSGALWHRILVAGGVASVVLPADVTPSAKILLRVRSSL